MNYFPIRLQPLNNESIGSFLYRIMKANFYPSINFLVYEMGVPRSKINNNELDQKNIELIANLTRGNLNVLEKMTPTQWSSDFGIYNHKIVIKNRVKFCPACIQEVNYQQVWWLYYQLNICFKHCMILVDLCGRCNGKIVIDSLIAGHCPNCGFIFANSRIVQIDAETTFYDSQLFFLERFSTSRVGVCWFSNLSLSSYLLLAFCSLSLLQNMKSNIDSSKTIEAFHNKRDSRRESSKISDAFADVYWMYQDFPNHFFKVLKDFQENKQNQLMYIQKARFELVFENEQFSHLKSAYESYWVEQMDLGKVRRDLSVFKKEPELLNNRTLFGIEEARALYGLSTHKIRRLSIEQPVLQSKVVQGKYTRYLIPKEKLDMVSNEYQSYITKGEVAQILGIQKDSVPKLIKARLLECHDTEYVDNDLLSLHEVKSFLNSCRGKYVKKYIEGIQFHDALVKYSINGLTIVKLIEFAQKKILNPISLVKNGSLADNYYFAGELEECMIHLIKERQDTKGYNMTEVLKMLKVGEKKMWCIMNDGILIPDHIQTMKDGRKHYFFNKEKVKIFLRECVTNN